MYFSVSTNDYVYAGLRVDWRPSVIYSVEMYNNGKVASIPVVLSGSAPWTLSYRVTGASSTPNFTDQHHFACIIQLTGDGLAEQSVLFHSFGVDNLLLESLMAGR